MSEHTTHFDDCGCKSARLEADFKEARDRAEKAEALVSVLNDRVNTLKAECRAWREMDRVDSDERHTAAELHEAWQAVRNTRAATDALGGVE